MEDLIHIFVWIVGISYIILIFVASWSLHEGVSKTWFIPSIGAVIIIAWFSPSHNLISLFSIIFLILILVLYIITSAKHRDQFYKINSEFGKTVSPPLDYEPDPPGTQSMFGYLIKQALARRQAAASPPSGYWSVIFPNSMTLGKEHEIQINLSPLTSTVKGSDEWLEPIQIALKHKTEVIISVTPIAQAFEIKPLTRELPLRLGQKLSTYFFVTPTRLGNHKIRVEVSLEKTLLGWFQETIQVGVNVQIILSVIGTLAGFIATILSILVALKVFP